MDDPYDLSGRSATTVSVVCLACTGSQTLANALELPVVCVRAVSDITVAVRQMNERRHGSGFRWPQSFQPFDFEAGWTDWATVPLEGPGDNGLPPAGVRILAGRIVVPLPAGVTLQEYQSALAGALRPLRLQDACIEPAWLERRSRDLRDYVFHPRYTPERCPAPDAYPDFADCRLVTDLVTLDPLEEGWRLYWIAVAARMAACDGRLSKWR